MRFHPNSRHSPPSLDGIRCESTAAPTPKEKYIMKHPGFWTTFILVLIFVLLFAPSVLAQRPAEPGAKQSAPAKYDFATETTLKGTVEEVRLVPGPNEGTHVMLKTGSETVLVHIAPPEFLKEFEFPVNKGDQLQVTGSKLMIDGQEEVLAKEITKDNNSFTLRDKKGIPAWTAWPKK